MKAREEHNQRMQFNVDKILQNINSSPELQGPNPLEDKGSNFKGKNQTANQGQQHPHILAKFINLSTLIKVTNIPTFIISLHHKLERTSSVPVLPLREYLGVQIRAIE